MTDLRTNPLRVAKTALASLVLLGTVSAHAATYPSRTGT
jgi:hypothetical protein